ncbi:hypothetical protein CgunFtcFv8_022914 [Champsocephalus gunnari]|uniref:Uncharacterized protein n=1 Tax=Champsocephalus gunnari TaxID=52237 RepID=A0AAN8HJT9_CHAGU|nr:hypothetical protein CgunFtcFv8_022914 [Champsocephalus gunnari]
MKDHQGSSELKPAVLITILARNAQHSLPYFLGCIDRLDYPKDRIFIWLACDHSLDLSRALLQAWLCCRPGSQRWSLSTTLCCGDQRHPALTQMSRGPKHWSKSRFTHVMKLRQQVLRAGRRLWADCIQFVDSDNLLTNSQVLSDLMAEK